MRLLVIGGYGFIGSEIVRALIADGHDVSALGRDAGLGRRLLPEARWIGGDLSRMTAPDDWRQALHGIDMVINASGLLQGSGRETVDAVQGGAVTAMAEAAHAQHVRRIVQISSVGTDDNANPFMDSKRAADEAIARTGIDHVILRPGLVVGRNAYGGTALIRQAAVMPIAMTLPVDAPIQTVAMADVLAAVRAALAMPPGTRAEFDLVSEPPMTLAEIVAAHRRWLGLAPLRGSWRVPAGFLGIAQGVADALGMFGWRSPLRRNAIRALAQGVLGRSAETRALLGRDALSLDETLGAMAAGRQDRLAARLDLLLPVVLVSLGAMWLLSGIGTLLRIDEATALLTTRGVEPTLAHTVAILGAIADILLALGLLWRRWARPALVGMILLTLTYLAAGSVLAPGLWLDPLAPFAKTLPGAVLALIGALMLDKR